MEELLTLYEVSKEVPALNYYNERRVLTQVVRMCRSSLEKYIQSLAQDKLALEGDLSPNMRNIIEYTREEKLQTHKLMNWAENALDFFDMEPSEAIEKIKNYEGNAPYRKQVLLPLFEREAGN